MIRRMLKVALGILLVAGSMSARGQIIDVSGNTNGNSFGYRRLLATETALQTNTNTVDIVATSNAFVAADAVLAGNLALIGNYPTVSNLATTAVQEDTAVQFDAVRIDGGIAAAHVLEWGDEAASRGAVLTFYDTGVGTLDLTSATNTLLFGADGRIRALHADYYNGDSLLNVDALDLLYPRSSDMTNAYSAADTVVSNAFVAADAVVVSGYGSADTIISNAFVAADGVVNSNLTVAFTAADVVTSNGLITMVVAADTVVSNAFVAADSALASGYAAADTAVSNAFIAADTALSNTLAAVATGITATTATNIAQYVVSTSNSLYATAAQGTTADSAMQPADGTAISNAFIAADTVLSNALSGGSASIVAPVSPYGLVRAYTFDGVLTNDWFGVLPLSNPGGMSTVFDSEVGGYLDNPNNSDNAVTGGALNTSNSFTIAFSALEPVATGDQYVFWARNGSNLGPYVLFNASGWKIYYYNGGTTSFYAAAPGDTNVWTHLAITYDHSNSNVIAYVDGAFAEEEANADLARLHDGTLILANNDASSNDDIDIGYFYVWDRLLSSNEVVRLHSLESAGQYGVQGLRRP